MIQVTHLNSREFYLNSDLIQYVESTPDTLIVLTSGDKIMVKESAEEVIERFIQFKRNVMSGLANAHLHIVRHEMPEKPLGQEE